MKKWSIGFLAASLAMALSGCSTMTPARYAVSMDNNMVLKEYQGKNMDLVSLTAPTEYDSACRMMGPIHAADGETIPEFVRKAFNDEFKFAGVYGDSGAKLSGSVDKIEFSSTSGLTNGWWDLAVTLKSSNGNSMSVENKYKFKSGFDAITACNQTAQALGPAVQDLIQKSITDPRFKSLLL